MQLAACSSMSRTTGLGDGKSLGGEIGGRGEKKKEGWFGGECVEVGVVVGRRV